MIAITRGERPPRPTHPTLTDRLWELMNQCWDQDRHNRPRMLEVLFALKSLIHERTRPSSPLPAIADTPTQVLDIQQRLEKLDPSNEEYRPLLHALLVHQDLKPHIQSLRREDLQRFIELVDKAGKVDIHPHRCLYYSYRRLITSRSQTISFERPYADYRAHAATVRSSHSLTSSRAENF